MFLFVVPKLGEKPIAHIDHNTKAAGNPNPLFSDSAKADIHRHADPFPASSTPSAIVTRTRHSRDLVRGNECYGSAGIYKGSCI
jgi:hypothetical protein